MKEGTNQTAVQQINFVHLVEIEANYKFPPIYSYSCKHVVQEGIVPRVVHFPFDGGTRAVAVCLDCLVELASADDWKGCEE